LVKKKQNKTKIAEGREADRAGKPPSPLAQGLDPPLLICDGQHPMPFKGRERTPSRL